ncbi:uncharacterized protein TEOVI_000104700 [Trypanosoma equiperdum]|uniref:Uncharacterized protein n=2 Tax=Trypanozoon TaxID=39700 RepID=Q386G8_TRYB2|nr:hypothetical protein, conserved [Trypanosoma brucei brucei TREU927]EAN79313.1 hypothetical protein, conserved [Trypanosoma brucei brucei TREU927]SCU69481.1 hypothetical protein, conserved [Trypanosoma equiperdum]
MKPEGAKGAVVSDDVGGDSANLAYCSDRITLLSRADIEAFTCCSNGAGGGGASNSENHNGGCGGLASEAQSVDPCSTLDTCIAALPMFLQSEALVLRRHEQQFRHHMKELVELTECITLLCDGSLRQHAAAVAGQPAEQSADAQRAESAALHRMLHRAEELERYVRAAAVERLRSAQRMVLAASTTKRREKVGRKSAVRPPKATK